MMAVTIPKSVSLHQMEAKIIYSVNRATITLVSHLQAFFTKHKISQPGASAYQASWVLFRLWQNLRFSQVKFLAEIATLIFYLAGRMIELNVKQVRVKAKMFHVKASPNDSSVMKALFLRTCDVLKKWVKPVANWARVLNQLFVIF
jgi:hypothetical protein